MSAKRSLKEAIYTLFDRGLNRYQATKILDTSFATANWHWSRWRILVESGQRVAPARDPVSVTAELDAWEVDRIGGLLEGELEMLSKEGPDGDFDPAAEAARVRILLAKLGL
jgi:hypothetical protein